MSVTLDTSLPLADFSHSAESRSGAPAAVVEIYRTPFVETVLLRIPQMIEPVQVVNREPTVPQPVSPRDALRDALRRSRTPAQADSATSAQTTTSAALTPRRFPRRPGAAQVQIRSRSELAGLTPLQMDDLLSATPTCGRLLDVSLQGACLTVAREYPLGEELILRFWSPATQRRVDTVARVVWSKPVGTDLWSIGCQLGNPLPQDQIQDVGQQPAATSPRWQSFD